MKNLYFKTSSFSHTQKLARILAQKILRSRKKSIIKLNPRIKNALVLALTGDLGTGKTTFAQGFFKALGIKNRVTSPTFILIKNYKPQTINYRLAYHIDCYRIKKPKELLSLGLKEILKNSKNIILIEWAEKIKRFLPKNSIWIKFEHGNKINQRIIALNIKRALI